MTERKQRQYTMAEGLRVTAIAMEEIQSWLGARPKTLTVRDVSSEHEYQRIDVDLLVTTPTGEFKLEIKGDLEAVQGDGEHDVATRTVACARQLMSNRVFP